jgi:hypothetical protein
MQRRAHRALGIDDGRFEIPADFDAELPPSVLADFER